MKQHTKTEVFHNAKMKVYNDGSFQATFCTSPIYKDSYDVDSINDTAKDYLRSLAVSKKIRYTIIDKISNRKYKYKIKKIQKKDKRQKTVFLSKSYLKSFSELKKENEVRKELNRERKYVNGVRADSIKRAKDKIFDIVYQNDWNYFLTITIDKQLLDRYDVDKIKPKIRNWLNNLVKRKGLKYILIPEYHKDGAIHCHALTNDIFTLSDSGVKTNDGKIIYNVTDWKYGFSTAIPVSGDKQSLSFYITKYITKDSHKIFGRFYWTSKNIVRDVSCMYFDVDFDKINKPCYGAFKYDSSFTYNKE